VIRVMVHFEVRVLPTNLRAIASVRPPGGRGKRQGGTCQSSFVPLPGLSHADCAEPAGGKRPGGTCQPLIVPLPGLSYADCAEPAGVSGRAVRVSLSVRGSAGPRFGPGQSGHVRARPTGAVVRASLGRRGGSRQSELRAGLQISCYGSRVAARGQCPCRHGLGAVCALGARFWKWATAPCPARGRGQAGRSLVPLRVWCAVSPPSLDVCCRPPPSLLFFCCTSVAV
jgi:hypothetical protein